MASEEIITGIDLGSSTIRIVVGQVLHQADTSILNIIGVSEVNSSGVSKGSITSMEDAVSSLSECLEAAERMIGLPIEHAWIGISGTHITSQESSGVIAISRTNGEIQEDDVERVVESARAVASPVNFEVLHIIPKSFCVDNQTGIKDPIGMAGIRLEVKAQIIQGLSSQVKNLTKTVYRTGLDIDGIVLTSLAASEAVLTNRQKELGVALVDVGGATTSIMVFEEGDVIHTAVLPIGADHITSDIAIGLQTSLDIAEKVKLEKGDCMSKNIDKKLQVNLKDFGGDDVVFAQKYISEIIEARVEEIFTKVDEELKKINRSGLLPAGIVLIGGGAKLKNIVEVAKKQTMLPVSLAEVNTSILNNIVDRAKDLAYISSLGLVLWGFQVGGTQGGGKGIFNGKRFPAVKDVGSKLKNWLGQLVK